MNYELTDKDKPALRTKLETRIRIVGECWIPMVASCRIHYKGRDRYSFKKMAMWIYKDVKPESNLNYYSTCDNQDCCNPDHLEAYHGTHKPTMLIRSKDGTYHEHRRWRIGVEFETAAGSRPDLCSHPSPRRLFPPGTFPMQAICNACGCNLIKDTASAEWRIIKSNHVRFDPQMKLYRIKREGE